jgi:hypothetical protein
MRRGKNRPHARRRDEVAPMTEGKGPGHPDRQGYGTSMAFPQLTVAAEERYP